MRIRVADYIVKFLADYGISHVFSVVGGGAMHLNNAFALESRINKIYNHHEQACVIAAESYSRINNEIAAVCVTSGPGGTNALTGVLCAWQDSLPLIVISGQVRSDITVDSTGLNLRQFGEQEYYIIKSVSPMTKYSVMIKDANSIKYHLQKALYLATSGRKGPVWIDVPLNIQGQMIETEDLESFDYNKGDSIDENDVSKVIDALKCAKRPVIIAGSGLRKSGIFDLFTKYITKLGVPIVCPTSTSDYYTPSDSFYYGMFGSFGGRVGNFIIQNADLLVVFGARLSFKQIGFNYDSFSPNSKKVVIDADPEELKKPTIKIDIPLCYDLADFIKALTKVDISLNNIDDKWIPYCNYLKYKFYDESISGIEDISAYDFAKIFWGKVNDETIVVLGNNTAAVSLLQYGIRKKGQRMYGNVNCGTMGYDLPAAIGAYVASKKDVYCITGEGSFQMNIQELQTMVHNDFPIKIIVFDNNKYQAIVQTHQRFFDGILAGCTCDSGISFPSLEKISYAYGFGYKRINKSYQLNDAIDWIINYPGRAILDLIQTSADPIVPKLSSKRLDNGDIVSPPIDDLAPFLDKEDYIECQFTNFIGEN